MSKFLFRASRPDLAEESGEIEAVSLEAARLKLTAAGLSVDILEPSSPSLPLQLPSNQQLPETLPLPQPAPQASGFRSRWKDSQKFNSADSPQSAVPPPPSNITIAPVVEPQPSVPPPPAVELPTAAAEPHPDQSKFKSRWRDNLRYNQSQDAPLSSPPPLLIDPPLPVAEAPLEGVLPHIPVTAAPPISPPAPAQTPRPFKPKWKENLERNTPAVLPSSAEDKLEAVLPALPSLEPSIPPPLPPSEELPLPSPEAKKRPFSPKWKESLRHNKPTPEQIKAALPTSLEMEEPAQPEAAPVPVAAAESRVIPHGLPLVLEDAAPRPGLSSSQSGELANAQALSAASEQVPSFLGNAPRAIPHTESDGSKELGSEPPGRRSSLRQPGAKSLSKGRGIPLELPPPSADPNESTPMGGAFTGSADELALGAPEIDVADELFSTSGEVGPVTSIQFAAPEAPPQPVFIQSRPAAGRPEKAQTPVETSPGGVSEESAPRSISRAAGEMEEALKSIETARLYKANKTTSMPADEIAAIVAQGRKTMSMPADEVAAIVALGKKTMSMPADEVAAIVAQGRKTMSMPADEVAAIVALGTKGQSKGATPADTVLDMPTVSSPVRRRPGAEPKNEPQMKKLLIRCVLFCVFLEAFFLLISHRTLSVEGSYKFGNTQMDPISLSFVLDNDTVIVAPPKDVQSTQNGPVTKYLVDVPYYKFTAPTELKVRIEVQASPPYVVDSIPLKVERGHMTLPLITLESRSHGSNVGKSGRGSDL